MNRPYQIEDVNAITSPALIFFKALIQANLQKMLEIAGGASRLRPHVKTHKTREIVRMEREMGIEKHKCATLAEAEMLASTGARDILIAYPMVGPNCLRLARLMRTYPESRIASVVDHLLGMEHLANVMRQENQSTEVFLDINVGQNRTGILPGPAVDLAEAIARQPNLRLAGLHVYDGHNNQESLAERESAVQALLEPVLQLREKLQQKGLAVERIVVGGTPTFPVYAKLKIPGLECSPGTCVLHDHGYGAKFQELGMMTAAVLLTRAISRPAPDRVTFDLGYKAVASDPPLANRLRLLDAPDARIVLQSEEHLVVETTEAERFRPGDVAYAIPTHICPTCAMHQFAWVVENGKLAERWPIVARDRTLTI